METTIPYELIQSFELEFGKKKTAEFIKFYNKIADSFDKKANDLALQKKFELKDELTKELATKADLMLVKADILLVKADLQLVRTELDDKIDKVDMKLTMRLNLLIILTLIALTLMNPVVAKLISNWLKLGL
jgi:hypothetical protein